MTAAWPAREDQHSGCPPRQRRCFTGEAKRLAWPTGGYCSRPQREQQDDQRSRGNDGGDAGEPVSFAACPRSS